MCTKTDKGITSERLLIRPIFDEAVVRIIYSDEIPIRTVRAVRAVRGYVA